MNVLILTPDSVGSTLLQRLITVYMQFHQFDKPVINLHELTNGIISYHSDVFNREILGKPPSNEWGYFQTLPEVVKLLQEVDHYKTARLAQYHIKTRNDTLADQINFYKYLNENFYIISCRRKNVLEHALGWAISRITKKLNFYGHDEKIEQFWDLYKTKIDVDQEALLYTLNSYKEYVKWSEQYFSISTYFNYERDIPKLEEFILRLPIFASQNKRIGWKDTYGIEFSDWNKLHYYMSDVGTLALENRQQQLKLEDMRSNDGRILLNQVLEKVASQLPAERKDFLDKHRVKYDEVTSSISKMVRLGIMTTGLPIKKQTFAEKKRMIRNFDQCVATYNLWAQQNPDLASPLDNKSIQSEMSIERESWVGPSPSTPLLSQK